MPTDPYEYVNGIPIPSMTPWGTYTNPAYAPNIPITPPAPSTTPSTTPSTPSATPGTTTPAPTPQPTGLGGWGYYGIPELVPWATWGAAPWKDVDEGTAPEVQTWLNTILPWYQQQASWQQFGEQMGYAREKFEREQEMQRRENEAQRALERETANIYAFGRRWAPQSRWM